MRRKDREVTGLENILAILDKCDVLRIGLCAENRPYIVPMNFAYEVEDGTTYLYLHCAAQGKKLDIIAKNNNVCFEADCLYETIKAENACNWSANYQSVMGEGNISLVAGDNLKEHALDLIMKRYGFEGKAHYGKEALKQVVVLKITTSAITGKIK